MKTLHTIYTSFAKRLAMLLIVLMTVSVGDVLAETVTFEPSDFSGQGTSGTGGNISATKDGVTFSCDKGYGTEQFRCYKDGKNTISSSNTITDISFTCTKAEYDGNLNSTYSGLSTTSWTHTLGEQARITQCVVTYTPSGGSGNSGDEDTDCLTLSASSNYPFNSTNSSNTSVYSTEIDGITFENKGGYKYNSYLSFNYDNPYNREVGRRLSVLCEETGHTAAQLQLAWLLNHPYGFPTFLITGVSSTHQLADSMISFDVEMTPEMIRFSPDWRMKNVPMTMML